jgi:ribosome-associated protein
MLAMHQAERIVILDVSGPLAITDWFVIASVNSTRQAQALARELDYGVKALRGHRRRNHGGMESEDSNWVLLDFDEVVVHLFLPEARAYYDLESLWADAPRLDYTPDPHGVPPRTDGQAAPGIVQFRVFPRVSPPQE